MDFKIIKKIVFGLLMTMGMLNAQNKLVFNRVLEMAISATNTATVPEGKVRKVESSSQELYVDKPNVDYGIPISNQTFSTGTGNIVWLSENSTIKVSSGIGKVSILEFNVVPTSTGTGSGTGGGGVSSDGLIFEEAMSITLTRTQNLNSSTSLFGEITVPEGKILKVFNVSTYVLSTVTGSTSSEGNGLIYIGDELFYPSLTNNIALIRFLPSGTHTVKMDWGSTGQPNRIVVNALLYSIP